MLRRGRRRGRGVGSGAVRALALVRVARDGRARRAARARGAQPVAHNDRTLADERARHTLSGECPQMTHLRQPSVKRYSRDLHAHPLVEQQ